MVVKKFGRATRECRRCKNHRGVIRKYGLMYCRRCIREIGPSLGFKRYG
ncbi:MAG: 30S ribosomal protein S14 [Candidatus Aenigmarchaeota archaeon]|nr:30S ribosomal protein S14 [Candidatus Aenigmarchaeota archaeon]